MLVSPGNHALTAATWWRRCLAVSGLVLVLTVVSLIPYLTQSTELVRIRNALLLIDPDDASFDWTPANVPASYSLERGPIDPFFSEVANRLNLRSLPDDWARALAISHHLLGSSPKLNGGAIEADLRTTYQRIVSKGDGYCGDFVDVFSAIALAAGMPVRSWAFSFDGYGGDGHVWPEIWNRKLGRWQLVGIFNNHFFYEADGSPLSAMELRNALLANSTSLKLAPLDAGARLGWSIEDKAWNYYRRGLPEWYMHWGNSVFTYDRAFLVRSFSGFSRSLEQLGGIAQGVFPKVVLKRDAANIEQVSAMWRLRMHLLVAAIVGVVASASFITSLLFWIRARAQIEK